MFHPYRNKTRRDKTNFLNVQAKVIPLYLENNTVLTEISSISPGPLAVGVPGELRGMWAAHKQWGKLPWDILIAPSLELCKTGFQMSKVMYDALETAPYIKNDPHLR